MQYSVLERAADRLLGSFDTLVDAKLAAKHCTKDAYVVDNQAATGERAVYKNWHQTLLLTILG